LLKNFALSLLFDPVDELVKDPRTRHKL
jgi:hypothetical protein